MDKTHTVAYHNETFLSLLSVAGQVHFISTEATLTLGKQKLCNC